MTYDICVSEDKAKCSPPNTSIGCQRWDSWAKKTCGKYVASQTQEGSGGACGYHTFHVECIDD
jgi:hypothetical protein